MQLSQSRGIPSDPPSPSPENSHPSGARPAQIDPDKYMHGDDFMRDAGGILRHREPIKQQSCLYLHGHDARRQQAPQAQPVSLRLVKCCALSEMISKSFKHPRFAALVSAAGLRMHEGPDVLMRLPQAHVAGALPLTLLKTQSWSRSAPNLWTIAESDPGPSSGL